MYKYSFLCSFHSCLRYIPFTGAIFLPFCLLIFTTEKTKTAIDYLDNRTNQQASRSSKGLFLVSMEHRRVRSSPNATPLAILGFSFIHTFHSLGEAFVNDFTDHKREDKKKPHLFSTPNHLPSSSKAQHRTANGKAENSIHARPPALYHTMHIDDGESKLAQLSVFKTPSQELP